MEIESASIEEKGVGATLRLVVVKGSHRIKKAQYCPPNTTLSGTQTILRLLREAERDIAYADYGEKWRQHIPPSPSFFSLVTTPEEDALIRQAREMLGAEAICTGGCIHP